MRSRREEPFSFGMVYLNAVSWSVAAELHSVYRSLTAVAASRHQQQQLALRIVNQRAILTCHRGVYRHPAPFVVRRTPTPYRRIPARAERDEQILPGKIHRFSCAW